MNELMRWIGDLQSRIERLESLESGASEGGWTPAFGGTASNGTITYTTQAGRYTRFADRVIADFDVIVNAVSVAPTGDLVIRGLPLVSSAGSQRGGQLTISFYRLTLTAGFDFPGGQVQASEPFVRLTQSRSNGGSVSPMPSSALGGGGLVRGTVIYEV